MVELKSLIRSLVLTDAEADWLCAYATEATEKKAGDAHTRRNAENTARRAANLETDRNSIACRFIIELEELFRREIEYSSNKIRREGLNRGIEIADIAVIEAS